MSNELDVFNRLSVKQSIPKADDLIAYYKFYMELCEKYHDEIEYAYKLQRELREERVDFFENKIKLIRQNLADEAISQETIDDWTKKLKEDYERSLDLSETFVRNFLVKKHDEFKKELENQLANI